MSAETTMYALKPIVSLPGALYHSQTMYKMRNIHEGPRRDDHTAAEAKIVPDITEQVTSFLKLQNKVPEFSALEARQEKILAQLVELKKQVSTLRNVLRQTNPSGAVTTSKVQEPVSVNVIVNVNPKRPPYSMLAMNKVWEDTEVNVKTYVHSTARTQAPSMCGQQDISNKVHKPNTINLSLIWKEVEDLEVVLGLRGYHIKGEVNLLRYLSRLINSHNYESSDCMKQMNSIDDILDLCHCLYIRESSKEKQEILSAIMNKLDKNESNKKELTLADIAVWSTVKQVFPQNTPSVINKWFQSREKLFI